MVRILIPILIILVAIAGFALLTSPMLNDLRSLRAEVSAFNEALNNSKELENERDKLTKQYNDIDTQNIIRLERMLPDSVDNIRLILEIEKIAMPYGMTLQDVQYDAMAEEAEKGAGQAVQAQGQTTSNKEYGTWELAFSAQGTYTNFVNFMKDLERNLRVVDATSVEFSSDVGSSVSGFTPVYKYTVKIKTYWLRN